MDVEAATSSSYNGHTARALLPQQSFVVDCNAGTHVPPAVPWEGQAFRAQPL